jgi:hypothetical protein
MFALLSSGAKFDRKRLQDDTAAWQTRDARNKACECMHAHRPKTKASALGHLAASNRPNAANLSLVSNGWNVWVSLCWSSSSGEHKGHPRCSHAWAEPVGRMSH